MIRIAITPAAFAAVADENESVMRNSELVHITLQKNDATFTIGTGHSRTKA